MRQEIIDALLEYIEVHGLGGRAGAGQTYDYDENPPAKIDSKERDASLQMANGTFFGSVGRGVMDTSLMK